MPPFFCREAAKHAARSSHNTSRKASAQRVGVRQTASALPFHTSPQAPHDGAGDGSRAAQPQLRRGGRWRRSPGSHAPSAIPTTAVGGLAGPILLAPVNIDGRRSDSPRGGQRKSAPPLRLFPFPRYEVEVVWVVPTVDLPTPPPGVLRPNVLRGDVRGPKGGGRVSVRRSVGYLSELQIPTQGTHIPFFAQCARVRTAAVPPGIAAQRGSIHMPASAPRVCPDRASLYFCAFSIHPSVYVSYLFLTPQRVGQVRLLRSAGLAPLATLQRSHTPTIHCISGRAAQLARLPTPNNGRPYPLLPDSNLISKHPNTSEPPLLTPPAG